MAKGLSEIFGSENKDFQMIDASRLYLVQVVQNLSKRKREDKGVLEKEVKKEIFRRVNNSRKFAKNFYLGPGTCHDLHNKDCDTGPTVYSMLDRLANSAGWLQKLRVNPNEYRVSSLGMEALKERRYLFSKYLT